MTTGVVEVMKLREAPSARPMALRVHCTNGRGTSVMHMFFFFYCYGDHPYLHSFPTRRSSDLQIKQLIRNGRSASLQRTFKKSFTSFSHSTRNKTRDGLIRVRNIRALNGRFNTSITHAYSIVIGSKHITLNATGGGFLTAS